MELDIINKLETILCMKKDLFLSGKYNLIDTKD